MDNINKCIFRLAKGDSAALDDLSCLSARMLSVALSVVKNRAEAEDVVQDSFLRIYQKAGEFCGGNGYAWICKITQNIALNRLRGKKLTENIDDCVLAAKEDVAERSAAAVAVQQAMSVLTPFEQRVIYQKYFMDLTVRESAKSLGSTRSTVARALKSGEEKLKNFLNGGTNLR